MADVWQFSPSSLPLLESVKTIAASQPYTNTERNKKWGELFKPISYEIPREEHVKHEQNGACTNDSEDTIIISPAKNDLSDEIETELQNIQEALDAATNKLDCLIRCDVELLPMLAEKVSKDTIDQICKELFSRNIDTEFVDNFFSLFLPVHIRKSLTSVDETSTIVDLLIKAFKTYPQSFERLMEVLLTDTEVPSKILEEFFLIDLSYCDRFLEHLSVKELPPEAFIHHLNTISCLYKHSKKSFDVQNFTLNCLVQASDRCKTDKAYGRFMLTFFQNLKNREEPVNKLHLEHILKSHETPFKNPCLNIFKNL